MGDDIRDITTVYKPIRDIWVPNVFSLRNLVQTDLNIGSWRRYLSAYFDHQLPDLMEFGSPLVFDRSRQSQSTLINYVSAQIYPNHVDKYIQGEICFQAMVGSDSQPFKIHISPFMTREKLDSDSRRTIMDLSFPKGLSVNDRVMKNAYLDTNFQMRYQCEDFLNTIGRSAHILKVNISQAFRRIHMDPGDMNLLGLQHRGKLFLDLSLPFGFRLEPFSLVR